MNFTAKEKYNISDLLAIMEILRSPDGCPWDIRQTHSSIRRNLIEEAYEAAEAIDTENSELLKEELGDVLMQVVFHSRIEEESGSFGFGDVCDGVCKKMILRHPHIFGDVKADTAEEVLKNWDDIKRLEKNQDTTYDVLNGVSKALPALIRAEKLIAKSPFRTDPSTALKTAETALDAIRNMISDNTAASPADVIGNLLWAVVTLSAAVGSEPEESLCAICENFVESFADSK